MTNRYEELVEREDEQALRLRTTEYAIHTVLDSVFHNGNLNRVALKDIITSLIRLKHAQEMDLTLIRLDKALEAAASRNDKL